MSLSNSPLKRLPPQSATSDLNVPLPGNEGNSTSPQHLVKSLLPTNRSENIAGDLRFLLCDHIIGVFVNNPPGARLHFPLHTSWFNHLLGNSQYVKQTLDHFVYLTTIEKLLCRACTYSAQNLDKFEVCRCSILVGMSEGTVLELPHGIHHARSPFTPFRLPTPIRWSQHTENRHNETLVPLTRIANNTHTW